MRAGLTFGAVLGWCLAGRAAEPAGRYEFESPHMGTMFRIVLYAPDRRAAEAAGRAAFARVADLDRTLSDYKADSEVMRLCKANDAAPGRPTAVSADLFTVLTKAQEVAAASGGAFDVSVGPVVRLWRVARRTQQLPDPKELADARAKVGYAKIVLDPAARTVALKVPGMRLDFGGIGKGYAADEALTVLRGRGITRALVAASGDIAAADPPPGQPGWAVDIAPIGTGLPPRRLRLANAAVSTSGDMFQFVEIGGVRYSHVVDPSTGLGLSGRRSATVIAPTGTRADSLTKAASVLPPARALAVIAAVPGAAMYLVVKDRDDGPEVVTASEGFADFLARDVHQKK